MSHHITATRHVRCDGEGAKQEAINLPDGVFCLFDALNEIIKTLFLLAIRSPSSVFIAPTHNTGNLVVVNE
jgi:hypothetical protein